MAGCTHGKLGTIFRSRKYEENQNQSLVTAAWKETSLPTILSRYELKDIYNADDFGLFYQGLSIFFENYT